MKSYLAPVFALVMVVGLLLTGDESSAQNQVQHAAITEVKLITEVPSPNGLNAGIKLFSAGGECTIVLVGDVFRINEGKDEMRIPMSNVAYYRLDGGK
ncbi:hypothetical protein OKA05_27865 [Luteolibacter arcticus]|uniref:Uncharacterized protein n=1 Tax=Luteolibacter arcticus TaxID=1581411 RepID=A0ABT3GSD0_9BACT|nr:hypothetical protein [Luteolibacter arcticus]MCW1926400.1 hypothetical protein [Luteolibacter arcticus]